MLVRGELVRDVLSCDAVTSYGAHHVPTRRSRLPSMCRGHGTVHFRDVSKPRPHQAMPARRSFRYRGNGLLLWLLSMYRFDKSLQGVGMPEAPDHDPPPDQIRTPQEIARRALALFAIVGLSLGAPKEQTLTWLKEESLWDELSPVELEYASAAEPTQQQRVNASWRSEALLVLVWALGTIDKMPALNEQCDAGDFQQLLPPFASISARTFVARAERRSDEALIELADELLNAHWEARDARIHGKTMPPNLDIGVIQERHHAINWVIGYDGLPWDEVTTDT